MSNQIIVVTTQANVHALLHKYTGLPQELEAYVPGAKMVTSVSPGYVFSIVESPSYPGQIGIIADFGNNEYGAVKFLNRAGDYSVVLRQCSVNL